MTVYCYETPNVKFDNGRSFSVTDGVLYIYEDTESVGCLAAFPKGAWACVVFDKADTNL